MLQNGQRHISYIVLLMIVGLLCTLHTLLPSYQPSCWQSFSLLGGQSAAAMTACSPSRDPAVYTRHQLLGLRCVQGSKSKVYVNEVAIHGLLCYRGNRAGQVTHHRQGRASVYKHDPDRQPGTVHSCWQYGSRDQQRHSVHRLGPESTRQLARRRSPKLRSVSDNTISTSS